MHNRRRTRYEMTATNIFHSRQVFCHKLATTAVHCSIQKLVRNPAKTARPLEQIQEAHSSSLSPYRVELELELYAVTLQPSPAALICLCKNFSLGSMMVVMSTPM